MTQTIEIVRISPSTLNELRRRAGNNHLDDIILTALRAYDAGLEKERTVLEEVLEQAQAGLQLETPDIPDAGQPGNNVPEPVERDAVNPEPPVDQALDIPDDSIQVVSPLEPNPSDSDMLDDLIRPDESSDPSADSADISEKIDPEPDVAEYPQETVSGTESFDAEPQVAEAHQNPDVAPESDAGAIDEVSHPTGGMEEDEEPESPEPPERMEPGIISSMASEDTSVIGPVAEPDAAPSVSTSEMLSSAIVQGGDAIRLPVEAGNSELAYTTPEMGLVDGRIVHPAAWFTMLGEVVIRLGEVTGRNAHDLVALINESDLGIRGRVGDVRTLGFYPVRDAGLSIRKVSSGKTWSAIVKIANKFGMTVRVRLKWQDDKPGLHPGRYGLLHISVKNNSES